MVAAGGAPPGLAGGGADEAGRDEARHNVDVDVDVDVLVVGAGPVGMALALQAHQLGAVVQLVERRTDLARPSRAMLLWPRTLEALHRLGVDAELAEHPAARLRSEVHLGRHAVPLALADLAVAGEPQPPLMVRQADVERALHRAVAGRGIPLATGTELVDLVLDDGGGAVAVLSAADGTRRVRRCRFVVGCDGADSAVRQRAGIPWEGRTYRQEAVLADLETAGLSRDAAHIGAGRAGIGFLFPAGEHGAGWRLVATRVARGPQSAPGRDGSSVSVPGVQAAVRGANLPGRVFRVAWSTRVRLQRRRAASFRRGPVLLAGDAAHVVSPAGAQGLNTGLQDAANLGWKLAAALRSADPETLLASYEAERLPVARQVARLSGLLLLGEGADREPFRMLRTVLLPSLAPAVPALLRLRAPTAVAGWVLAQGWVSYASSPLSGRGRDRTPTQLRPGQHMPGRTVRVDRRAQTLRALTADPAVHVLHGDGVLAGSAVGHGVRTHRVDGWPPGAVVTVRPDGYVGFVGGAGDEAALEAWLALVGAGIRSEGSATFSPAASAASRSSRTPTSAAKTDQGSSETMASTRPTVPRLEGTAISSAATSPQTATALLRRLLRNIRTASTSRVTRLSR